MLTLEEVREKLAEIDARIKAEKKLRTMWAGVERALVAEAAMNEPRKDGDDE
jgi:hypothetical protein